ncbi:MAG TPA: xanthine dehydrogenase family protein molybdopterin-binding subunit [Xanthobacteraceae bacterium]
MNEPAGKPFIGRSMLRREDRRLLLGHGQYVDDLVLPRMLHAALVRSPLPHARIRSVDLTRAAAAPGVAFVLSGLELARLLPTVPDHQVALPSKWRTTVKHHILNPQQSLLAGDKVRHVGEAFAVVVAESRYAAEDAAALVEADLEPLPAVVDPEQALEAGAAIVHEQFGSNLIAELAAAKGDAEGALRRAPRRLARRFHHHRYAALPIECRGVLSEYDERTQSMTIWSSTQVVHWLRREAAATLGIAEARVRCVAPDVGGGFGIKGHVYPEDLLIPFLARKIGRPVKWIEDRREHLMCSCHSRDQIHDLEIGFDDDGRILGYRDRFLTDIGAFNPIGSGVMYNTIAHLAGPYRIDDFSAEAKIVTTNKVPNAPYRGAGRPEAALVTERAMDLIAAELGLEPAEVRRRNMIRPDEMPYKLGIVYRDGEPIVYDGGDYPGALDKALVAIGGLDSFRQRQKAARAQGRHLGIGLGCYTEGTGAGPFEGARIRIEPSGKIYVAGGACPQGQGMETIFAQIVADTWQVDPEDVIVALADTAAIPIGFGTVASRSTVTLSAAIHHASERLREKMVAIAANMLECAPQDLELRAGKIGVIGVPAMEVPLGRLARAAAPGWDHGRPAGIDAGLEETYYWEPPTVTWSYAVHAAIVEVDTGTGAVRLDRYAVAHDCGLVINPMLVEGQIIGGTVQGMGGGLLERLPYDKDGQPLTGSLMDYLVPVASDVPDIAVVHLHSPSPLNPLGVKGLGEGGAIAPPVAIANAVCDALAPFSAEFNSTPVMPQQIVAVAQRAAMPSRLPRAQP